MIIRRPISQVKGLQSALDTLTTNLTLQGQTFTQNLQSAVDSLNTKISDNKAAIEQTVSQLDAVSAKKAANLADLTDVSVARTSISVYSKAETESLIDAAKLALGTNYTVNTVAERDALPGLDVNDRITVTSGGNWTTYGVESVTGGVASFYVMTSKQEWEAANSASAIKTAYESNDDTNAYTDAEQVKVGFISITRARDLDKLIQSDELIGSAALLAGNGTSTQIASANAVQAFVHEVVRTGGTRFKSETLTVTNDKIVLSFAPKDGVVLNYQTVRIVEGGDTWADVEVTIDATDLSGKTYIVAGDASGQFDGKGAVVQYPYIELA